MIAGLPKVTVGRKAVGCVVPHRGSSRASAIDSGAGIATGILEQAVCSDNCVLSGRLVEILYVAHVIDVDPQQTAGFDVAQEVGSEDHSVPDFMLDAEVHLHGNRSLVAGSKQAH